MPETKADQLSRLCRHCRMYLFGAKGHPAMIPSEVAQDFTNFALLHLACTMFITTDDKSETKGGVFHRILDPLGYSSLLTDIDDTLQMPVGKTTLKQFLRTKRNKLATHGTMGFDTQDVNAQEVINDEQAIFQFNMAMEELDQDVQELLIKLEKAKYEL